MFIVGKQTRKDPCLPRQLRRLASPSSLAALIILSLTMSIDGCAPASQSSSSPVTSRPATSLAAPPSTTPAAPPSTTPAAPPSTTPAAPPSTTPAAPPSITVTSPSGEVHCPNPAPQCKFQVTGQVTGTIAAGLEILVLVFPVNPPGGGWYIQWPPAITGPGDAWLESPAYIGSPTAVAHDGDTLEIEAVLVRPDASFSGTSLHQLSKEGTAIPAVNVITGLVTQSAPAQLTVRRS
jgi:hypothetical protein